MEVLAVILSILFFGFLVYEVVGLVKAIKRKRAERRDKGNTNTMVDSESDTRKGGK